MIFNSIAAILSVALGIFCFKEDAALLGVAILIIAVFNILAAIFA
jgi:hypothetical protein